MEKKPHNYIIYILSYLYIFIGYSYIIYYISYHIRITNKPEGWAYMIAVALIYFIIYSVINHIFISKVLSHKLLIIIEALLFVSMFTLGMKFTFILNTSKALCRLKSHPVLDIRQWVLPHALGRVLWEINNCGWLWSPDERQSPCLRHTPWAIKCNLNTRF